MMFNHKQAGFTLIEMMIAMVLGLFVTAVIITVFSTNVRSSTESIKMIRLNQELKGTMTLISDELKRHGYSSDPSNSGFMDALNYDSANNCLQYAYDSDDDGSLNPSSDLFSIYYTASTIFWLTSSDTDCDNPATSDALTDPNIAAITAMTIDRTGSVSSEGGSGSTVWTSSSSTNVYEVRLTLTGQVTLPHSTDPVARTVVETIRFRNDDPN